MRAATRLVMVVGDWRTGRDWDRGDLPFQTRVIRVFADTEHEHPLERATKRQAFDDGCVIDVRVSEWEDPK